MTTSLHTKLLGERFPHHCIFDWQKRTLILDLEWTRRGDTIFLRPRDAPLEVLWSCGTNRFPPDDALILESIEWAFRRCNVSRCHRFGEGIIFINRNHGVVPHPTGFTPETQHQWPFGATFELPKKQFPKFQKPQRALLCSPEFLNAGLSELAANKESDFNIASRWVENYRDLWSRIEFTILTRDVMEHLLTALWFIYAPELLPARIPVLRGAPNGKVAAFIHSARWQIPQRLLEVFNASSGLESVKRGCIYAYGRWFKQINTAAYTLDIPSPTDQQRAEAVQLWREFLHDKMSQSEIESLLPNCEF